MKKILYLACCVLCLVSSSFAVTFSGANVPYDSSFHLGLVNGPGTGLNVGADVFSPISGIKVGGEIEYIMTNTEFEQNISIQKFGLVLKYVFSEEFYLTLHFGGSPFYLTKAVEYADSFSGERYTIEEDTHGHASYWAIAPNIKVWDYYFTPKLVFNKVEEGGTIMELDLNIGHRL